MKVRIDGLNIFDWYDGVILAVATASEREFLVNTAAYNMSTGERVYLLLEIDRPTATILKAALSTTQSREENWAEFSKTHSELLRSHAGSIYITAARSIKLGDELQIRTLDRNFFDTVRESLLDANRPFTTEAVEFWENARKYS